MSRVIIQAQPVFFLQMRKYSESSLLLDCFSPDYGRFQLIAKGIKTISKKNTQALPKLFQAYGLNAILKPNLGTLTGLEILEIWSQPVGKPWIVANYINELLLKLLPNREPVKELYTSYVELLYNLVSGENFQLDIVFFEKCLLETLGYGVNLYSEFSTGELIEDSQEYTFEIGKGFYYAEGSEKTIFSGALIKALQSNDKNYFENKVDTIKLVKKLIRMSMQHQFGDLSLKTVSVSKELNQIIHSIN